ncbi:hypothetical protein KSP40_PGU010119 [Platanthera guangdongensis]|uniref:MobA-like NTP transferase domain-containing protein n=1 Tax=Platanthera guangdongensis TaxID=2320717 RepID=A0ABR2MLA1_9ASPA
MLTAIQKKCSQFVGFIPPALLPYRTRPVSSTRFRIVIAGDYYVSPVPAAAPQGSGIVKDRSVSVVLLAGGKGKRMGADVIGVLYVGPLWSCIKYQRMKSELSFLSDTCEKFPVDVKFALPGKERQDSVFSGLQVPLQHDQLIDVNAVTL